jgi:hypothetical protein|nr:MAG TPA: Protein of unknown function (DUF1071) [Caudoviricetes sp.]
MEEVKEETKKEKSIFETLNSIDVGDKIEKKNGLSYLSWAWAWAEVKKLYPNANYKIYERDTQFGLVNYFTDGKTCWVKTGVTIGNLEHIEELPVMDYRNKSILLNNVTSFDVNKAIQRSLTKALARHGLGLYIYAGEDLPEELKEENKKQQGFEQANLMANIDNCLKKLKELGVDINSKGSIDFINKYNNNLHDINIMTDSEKYNYLKVLNEMIKLKEKQNVNK